MGKENEFSNITKRDKSILGIGRELAQEMVTDKIVNQPPKILSRLTRRTRKIIASLLFLDPNQLP